MKSIPDSVAACIACHRATAALAILLLACGVQAASSGARPMALDKAGTQQAPHPDLAAEWRAIGEEALGLRRVVTKDPKNERARQALAELTTRAASGAEHALARGSEDLFRAYRQQITTQLHDTRWRLGRMAERGSGAADYALGVLALHGILDEQNLEQACARFSAALDKGYAGARFRTAQCVEEQDPARAERLMREAADAGHAGAMEDLGRRCVEAEPPDAACGYARLEAAARGGRATALTLLGWMHANGVGGREDLARAVKLYEEAASQGELAARNNLAELHENGRGVPRDAAKAYEHYRLAAEAGFAPAQFNLGRLYAAGRGVQQSDTEARRWLGEAAKAGIEQARRIIELLDAPRSE